MAVDPYEQQVKSRAIGAPQYAQQQGANGVGEGLQALGKGAAVAANAAAAIQEQTDAAEVLRAQQELSISVNSMTFDPEAGFMTKTGRAAVTVPDSYMPTFDKEAARIRATLKTPRAQEAYDKIASGSRVDFDTRTKRFALEQNIEYQKGVANAAVSLATSNAAMYAGDADRVAQERANARAAVLATTGLTGLSGLSLEAKLAEVDSAVIYSTISAMADKSPTSAIGFYEQHKNSLFGPDIGKAAQLMQPIRQQAEARSAVLTAVYANKAPQNDDDMVNFVIDALEGGSKIAQEPGGAIAKYGINSAAHPNVDVKNLTRAGATEIYKRDYLPQAERIVSGGDNPIAYTNQQKFIVYDAVVNHRGGFAKEMFDKSGGDVGKMLQLREEEYRRLARENPEKYGNQLEGWLARLDKLRASTGPDATNGRPSLSSVINNITESTADPEVAAKAITIAKQQYDAIEKDEKDRAKSASDQWYGYIAQGVEPPPSVDAAFKAADPKGYQEALNSGSGVDYYLYGQLRESVIAGEPVDLWKYRSRLGGKYDDLLKLQEDPKERPVNKAVDDAVKKALPAIIGRTTIRDDADYQQVDRFTRSVMAGVKALGDNARPDDIQRLVDYNLLNTRSGMFGSSKRLYELSPEQAAGGEYSVVGVPKDRNYVWNSASGPRSMEYKDVVDTVLGYIDENGWPVTDEYVEIAMKQLTTGDNPRLLARYK